MKMVESLFVADGDGGTEIISPGGGTGGYHDPFHGIEGSDLCITGDETSG